MYHIMGKHFYSLAIKVLRLLEVAWESKLSSSKSQIFRSTKSSNDLAWAWGGYAGFVLFGNRKELFCILSGEKK
jgi:hypothetical protein